VAGQVDPAQRVQAQAPAAERLGNCPQEDRRIDGVGQSGDHGAIGKSRLKNQQKVHCLGRELASDRLGRGEVCD
jgi:hypothetical protein